MEGTRHVSPVRPEPCVVRIGRGRADERRGLKNDLVLAEADNISGFHAEVRFSNGVLHLKDLKSLNGTYAQGKRVMEEVEIRSGDVFLLSMTPIEARLVDEEPAATETPTDERLSKAPFLQKLLDATRASARKRGDTHADTRDLADALLQAADPRVQGSLRERDLAADRALVELWGSTLYVGASRWLCPFLQKPKEPTRKETSARLSPRVRKIFGAVAERLSEFRAPEAEALAPGALLAELLASSGPVGAWLAEHRISPPPMPKPETDEDRPTIKTTKPARVSTTVEVAKDQVADTRMRTTPMRVVTPALLATTGDVVLDQRARAIALQLEEAAALYRFSTPEDRRSMFREIAKRELAAIAPENRARIVAQIRVQFPVIAAAQPAEGAARSGEVPRLQRRIEELEHHLRELPRERPHPEKGSTSPRTGAWHEAFAEGPIERDAPAELRVLREIVAFASKMEKFLLGLIQGVTMPGNVTATFRLPAYRHTLESVLSAVRQGKPFEGDRFPEYLRELERWQVAILAAHHESARLWFEKIWKKASPTAIEASTARSATWKIRGDAAEWWNRYKEVVRGLTPEVVQDQVLQTAYRFALEEVEKLKKGRGQ